MALFENAVLSSACLILISLYLACSGDPSSNPTPPSFMDRREFSTARLLWAAAKSSPPSSLLSSFSHPFCTLSRASYRGLLWLNFMFAWTIFG